MIFAEVIGANRVDVTLRGGVPKGAPIKAWVQKHGAVASDASLAFTVTPNDIAKLDDLAAAFRPVVRPGAPRYAEKAYEYVCPRTAAALERLSKALAAHWV